LRILVTGGAGFIGSNLARHLAAHFARRGDTVVAADDFSSAHFSNLIDFPGDVLTLKSRDDIQSMQNLGPFDAIFHQASMTGVVSADGTTLSGPEVQQRMLRNNVETFRAILDWAVATKARVVWASSCSIYGRGPVPMRESQPPDPLNIYAMSKLLMERLAAAYAPKLAHPIVGLRYTNVYGPGEDHKGKLASMIHQLAKQMRAGRRPRIFTAGEQKRDFVYIDDVVQANLLALKSNVSSVFNVGSGCAESFNRVVAELNRALKTDLKPDYFENPYAFTQDVTEADLTAIKAALAYSPKFDLASGIDSYLASGKLGVANE
jgi:ADP-L-glycero-D-manno-heptose 6-epimerase